MSKILKVLGAIVLILAVVFVIAGLMGPKEFRMERSIVVRAPRSVIYGYISDYRNWPQWSPWYELDTNCRYEYFGQPGQADAGYRWEGNDKAGKGEMRTTEVAQDMDMKADLHYYKPYAFDADIAFQLDSAVGGDTKVTWSIARTFGFAQRPAMLFVKLEKYLAPDFEKGLAKLKVLCESGVPTSAPALRVQEAVWMKKTYVAYHVETSTDSMSSVFMDWMPKVYSYMTDHKLVQDGAPSGIYYTWDTVHKRTDMAIAIPVKNAGKVDAPYQVITIDAAKAVLVDCYGPYERIPAAHGAIATYLAVKGIKKKDPAIEEYVSDPIMEKDTNKVLTKVWYLVD